MWYGLSRNGLSINQGDVTDVERNNEVLPGESKVGCWLLGVMFDRTT